MEYFTLNTGNQIPAIAYGPGSFGGFVDSKTKMRMPTCKLEMYYQKAYKRYLRKIIDEPWLHRQYVNTIAYSFKIGFNLLDFSASYGDGKLIGEAIKKSGIDRKDLYITSRVSNGAQRDGEVRKCVLQQIENMGVEYLDILMFHWPVTDLYLKTWREMVKLYEQGYCKNLAVANCHEHHLEAIINECGIVPAINQVEVHPLFTQLPLRQYCKEKGIQIESYTALSRMDDRLFRLPKLQNIATKYGKTTQQVVLRWHIQNGLIPCVRSLNKNRQLQNISIFDFELTNEEIKTIDSFNINARVRYDPDNCDFSVL